MAGSARILICRSNPLMPDPRVEKIARALMEAQFPTTVLGWDMSGEYPTHEDWGGIDCYRCRVKVEPARGMGNLINEIRWQFALLGWLLRNRSRFDLVHACDFDTLLPALVMKFLFRKIIVYDIFDFFADMLRATPAVVKNIIRRVDLAAINRVDAVVLADDVRLEQIAGSRPKRMEIIYNSPEDQDVQPVQDEDLRVEKPALKIAYIGNLQIERGLLDLVSVLEKHPEYALDLAGFGGDEKQILTRAERLDNVSWHGRVSYQVSLQLSYSADVMTATYSPVIPNHRFSSPNKVFEAMMLGKPIIVARDTNADRIVEKEEMGLVVDYGNISQLETAFESLANDVELRHRLGENARRAYDNTYSWQLMKQRLVAFYNKLVVECGLQ